MGGLPGARNPYPFPDTIKTHFQKKSKTNIYPIVDKQYMLIFNQLTLSI